MKRLFDVIVAVSAFTVFSPLFILISLSLKFSSIGQVFFLHQRPGLNGKPFKVIKFKTMNDKKNEDGKLLPNIERITPLGAFLRNSSLDEIPQLLNVIKGDISLVGPRPLEMRYLPLYSKIQNRRHEVRPGITGWAQVNGRNTISWEKKFELDVWYVDNRTFFLDIKILLLTIRKVLKSEGVNESKTDTVVPFDVYLQNKNV